MDRICKGAPDAHDGTDEVRPGSEIRDLAQELDGMPLLLERVVDRAGADDLESLEGELDALRLTLACDQPSGTSYGGTGRDLAKEIVVVEGSLVHDGLQALDRGSVVDLQEAHVLAVTFRPDPSFDTDDLVTRLAR